MPLIVLPKFAPFRWNAGARRTPAPLGKAPDLIRVYALLKLFYPIFGVYSELNKLKLALYTGYFTMKIRLKVTMRKGARIESLPLKQLERENGYKKKRWEYKDGWLILDAF